MTLRLLDTFSGIGGFSYAAEHIVGGFETVAFVEREPYCQRILSKHWPNVPIYDDIATFNPDPHSADVICGGFPCQDISLAGKQAGIKEGTRSGLFYELMRVVRTVRPRYVVMENVAAILANGLDTVLGELAEAGFDAEWACIPASAVGACHQRDRWWLVAYAKGARAWEHQPHSRGHRDGEDLLADWHPNQEISITANTCGTRLERQEHPQWRIAQQLCPNWGGYISEPVLRRGDDGLSNRVDRLKALGNAVVPQVAAIPLARVLELESDRAAHPAGDPSSLQSRPGPPVPQ
jgi:DNA (cytosine-5)-methyltransferase 1